MKVSSVSSFALPSHLVEGQVRKRKQPLQDRSRATVDAIIEATLQVLLDGGLPRLTTTRVAERAGVSVGTLYQYFPDKRSLVMAIRARSIERVMGAIHALICSQRGRPLGEALAAIVSEVLRIKTENLRLTLVMRSAGMWPPGDGAMQAATLRLCDAMEALLRDANPETTNPRMKATVLVSALDGAISAAVADSPSLLQDKAFKDTLVALALGLAR